MAASKRGRMFCPKCGFESPEENRFCKSCGANLQLVSDVMGGKQLPIMLGQFGIDVEKLKRGARSLRNAHHHKADTNSQSVMEIAAELRRARREERRQRARQPKPREWLRYSWQHNLRDGLMSIFGGAGLGAVLFFLSRTASDIGLLKQLEDQSQVKGLELMLRLVWLFAAIPVLKGLAQILYAAFFAESIAKLTDRFLPPQQQAQIEAPVTGTINRPISAPPSVTEHTTNILEKEKELPITQEAERATS